MKSYCRFYQLQSLRTTLTNGLYHLSKIKGPHFKILFLVLPTNYSLQNILVRFKTNAMTNTLSGIHSTLSERAKTVHPKHYDDSLEKLITKLYQLKEKFESMYYGRAECKKYDKARAFTIELNATLYKANRIRLDTNSYLKKCPLPIKSKVKMYPKRYSRVLVSDSNQIKLKIKKLNKELNYLIH